MYNRELQSRILRLTAQFPVLSITGPRQSGKTTLCKMLFSDYEYYNLEDERNLDMVQRDINGFLRSHSKKIIFDEAHYLPKLFNAVQVAVDEDKSRSIVLSGSSNFLLMQSITQSLAGRVAIVRLMPLSLAELGDEANASTDELIFKGFYPAIWGDKRMPEDVYDTYFTTYIQRDVQQIINIKDSRKFRDFVRLCATRVGKELVVSTIADELSIDMRTVNSWLSILEASYTVFLLRPYFRNIGKRIVKTPKLYFYDTGLAAFLLGISTEQQMDVHPLRGALFENMVINDMMKLDLNRGNNMQQLFFYRDKSQREVDVLRILPPNLVEAYEIKSAQTWNADFFANLNYLRPLLKERLLKTTVVYDGTQESHQTDNGIINFRHLQW